MEAEHPRSSPCPHFLQKMGSAWPTSCSQKTWRSPNWDFTPAESSTATMGKCSQREAQASLAQMHEKENPRTAALPSPPLGCPATKELPYGARAMHRPLPPCTHKVHTKRAGGAGAGASLWVAPGEPNPAGKAPWPGQRKKGDAAPGRVQALGEAKAQLPCEQPGAQQAQFHRYPRGGTARLPGPRCLRCLRCLLRPAPPRLLQPFPGLGAEPPPHPRKGSGSPRTLQRRRTRHLQQPPTPQHPFGCKRPLPHPLLGTR